MKIQHIERHNKEDNNVYSYLPMDTNWLELKRFKCNRKNELYSFRRKTEEHYLLLSGLICINGEEYGAGTIISYEPYEKRNFFVLEDAVCISIKDPKSCEDDELQDDELTLDDFISPYSLEMPGNIKRFNNIEYSDISVVIQGGIDRKYTPMSIESVRRFLPGATIILSTWEGASVDGLDFDEVVFNRDPGAPFFQKTADIRHYDNRNRLLVSTQGGIKRVSTKYTLKMRSDCILCGDGVVRNYGRYPKKTGELCLFKNKLVVGEQCNIMKLYFEDSFRPYVFHVSDWFCFGLTEDVMTYFDGTEVESDEQMTRWKYKNTLHIPPDDVMGRNFSPRYNSEQYYFLSALRKKFKIEYVDISDYSDKIEQLSRIAIVNNFEIMNIRDHQIINAKKQNKQAWNLEVSKEAEFFTNKKYEAIYQGI